LDNHIDQKCIFNTEYSIINKRGFVFSERQCLAEVTKEHETTAPECPSCTNPCL